MTLQIKQSRSGIAQKLLYLEGKPFSLKDYPFYTAIYDGSYPRTLLKTARQVAKSTTLANFMIADSVGQPFFKTYYISPTQEQTRKFSHTRIGKTLAYSPEIRKAYMSDSIDNVYLRMMKNGSEMAFTYASEDADRARGYTADRCAFDEVQDILYEAVIPVIEECMANSNYAYSNYCGTPKTMENTIEFLWSLSSQTEWVMKCDGCSKHTFIVSAKAIGKTGPECLNCRKPLNPRNGFWADMKKYSPEVDPQDYDAGASIKGFHIPQLILPANVPAAWNTSDKEYEKAQERWKRILTKQLEYGDVRFENEVLGVSNAVGARLLTKAELEALCDENRHLQRLPTPDHIRDINRTFAGVDWSGGGAEVKGSEGVFKSRTVLTVLGERGDKKLQLLYYRIFPQGHAVGWIDEIVEICKAYGCQMVVGDAGEGQIANALLREKLGMHRSQQVRYGSASKPMTWNGESLSYHADRTTLMDNYAMALKQGRIGFPSLREMQPAITDILNIYEEVTTSGKRVWRHAPTAPDDCFHSQLFAWIAYKIICGDLRFYA